MKNSWSIKDVWSEYDKRKELKILKLMEDISCDYKKNEYLKLLKETQDTEDSGEYREYSLEFSAYYRLISNHLKFEMQNQFLEIIRRFLAREISRSKFHKEFDRLYLLIENGLNFLEFGLIPSELNQQSIEKGSDLSNLLNEIILHSIYFSSDRHDEEDFRSLIQTKFYEIQKVLNEE